MDFRKALQFIAAVPERRWTAYKDVAAAAGNELGAMAVGYWLRQSGGSIPNYWRVLTVDGAVPDTFLGGRDGPRGAATAREVLRREGIWIDADGRALQRQRFTVEDWLALQRKPRGHNTAQSVTAPTTPISRPPVGSKPPPDGGLRIGATARVRDERSGATSTWKIVVPTDANPREGMLSAEAPIARALMGHLAGEVVTAETPRGPRRLRIEEVIL
jgi:alkylated DNA nucleotide flippase Atl1